MRESFGSVDMKFFAPILTLVLALFNLDINASTLHLTTSSNPSRLNPILATDSASSDISNWIFNGLVKYDKDANIVPDLAESFRFIDSKTLEFTLRDGVKWHDGHLFSAEDVKFTYELLMSEQAITPYKSEMRLVKSVEIEGNNRIVVRYKKPYFKALNIWMIGIVPKHILKDESAIMTSSFNQKPVGTGPYRLERLELSKDIILKSNKSYHIEEPKIETIVYHVVPDSTTRFLMLKSSQIDLGGLSALQVERQLDDEFIEKYQNIEQISHSYTYLGFNLRLKKFSNRAVREAINLAIDREQLVDILFFKHGQPCSGPFLPGTLAFNPETNTPKVDIEKAKALLKEAGYTKKSPLEFEIATNTGNATRVYAAQIIQHQLLQVGIKVNIRAMEWQAFLNTTVFPREFETILLGWGLSLQPDAYAIWHSKSDKKGGFNMIGYSNSEVDHLIEMAEEEIDSKRFGSIYRDIFRHITDDLPYIFLYIPNDITAVNRDIKPIKPSIIGIMHNQIEWMKK